jgi:hypothetical protein
MRIMKTIFLVLICLATSGVLKAQNIDLTGTWKDDYGQIYQVRQIDGNIYWKMDNLPEVRNVFTGVISGKYFTGKWIDLPGGNVFNYGSLSLQVINPDRFVKIDQTGKSGDYRGNIWTRTTNSVASNFEPAAIVGLWDWQNGSAQLETFADGTFKAWVNGTQTNSGTWVCTDKNTRSYTLKHQQGGWIDDIVLSPDFKILAGRNQNGNSVTGTRIR